MLTRRRLLQGMMLASSAPLGALLPTLAAARGTDGGAGGNASATARGGEIDAAADPTRHVDVFIGTGGHGHTFPGASVPFGMVQLSPDTDNATWDACSGYHLDDPSIMGFSHTHLSGTGCADMLDVLLMPAVGPVRTVPGSARRNDALYHSRYDATRASDSAPKPPAAKPAETAAMPGYRAPVNHADEYAEPGYYRVLLRDRGVFAELSASARAGIHRYRFPANQQSHFIVDLKHGAMDDPHTPTRVPSAQLRVVGNDTLLGGRTVDSWAPGRQIYFAMQFSRPFSRFEVFSEHDPAGVSRRETQASSIQCALHMPTHEGEQIVVKVGISAVSAENALANLREEIPGWDFDGIRQAAKSSWRSALNGIHAELTDPRQQRIFYTALYHSLQAPTLFSDVDGRYRGMDMEVHQLPPGVANYTQFSLWDTYRALHPLLTLIQPQRVPDLVNSLIRMAAQSPAGVPVWPLQGRETGTMTGYHSAVVLAEAQAKGFRGIDFAQAWPLWRKRAMDEDYRGLAQYRQRGYAAADLIGESASKTLEYAYDDWAMAELAKGAGARDDQQLLLQRSRNYQHVFDAQQRFVRPRLADGSWAEPFDPRSMGHSDRWRDFTESNAWQATFLNQHDVHAYIKLFGGDQAFIEKLDALFAASPELPANAPPDIAGMLGQYAHGNEPSHHIAYLYAYAGQPWKTQALVRQLLVTMYADEPDGEAGNDDCGQVSAWYVLSALGFYPVDPVSGNYVLGSPLVERAELDVGGGRGLLVEARDNGPLNVYVQSVSFNGKPHPRSWISHAELSAGGHLLFQMGATPNTEFGRAPESRPPSFVA